MKGQTVGDFQVWDFAGCQSYAAHVIATPQPGEADPTLQLQVDQYDGSGFVNGVTQLFWHLGDEEKLLPLATQSLGSLQEHEIWSPHALQPTGSRPGINDAVHEH